jgi:CRISPR/Cas system-associated exonuclease Cas4 (RecB family)
MPASSAYHEILVRVLVRVKRHIYEKGVDRYREIFTALRESPSIDPDAWWVKKAGDALPEIRAMAEVVHEFEVDRVAARIRDCLARQPYTAEDSLVALAIPVVLEQKLDVSSLGLIHILDDELRQWLIEERDEKMRMVAEERDPGVSGPCPRYCQYRENCHPRKDEPS